MSQSYSFPQENLLSQSASPYLLQHADNPVHWRMWGDAAFDEAKTRNVPILLSIGYAACHWCHVMAHESFEDSDTAALMNELFVNVKVDREERPDVDAIYMEALHHLGQQGGWPLTMFVSPDGKPFWGGTYFPPTPRQGMPSFKDVLQHVSNVYLERPDVVAQNGEGLLQAIESRIENKQTQSDTETTMEDVAQTLVGYLDPVLGGLTGAPKFPQPSLLNLVWSAGLATQNDTMQGRVIVALEKMCRGGIYDHLGGGFARYSVDDLWLVPHFEKMLYDNAQLISLLCQAWTRHADPMFKDRVTETIDWLNRDMLLESGAFAASLDADTDGEEGKFYVWSPEEVTSILGPEAAPFMAQYDITEEGNFEGHSIPHLLYHSSPTPQKYKSMRETLRTHRDATRTAPGRDDKMLTDWNGMTITALTRAAVTFDEPDWLHMAERVYAAVVSSSSAILKQPGHLVHSLRGDVIGHHGLLEDYAAMIEAAVMLYQVTAKSPYLSDAVSWAAHVQTAFWYQTTDGEPLGYAMTPIDQTDTITRPLSATDGATPSGNGVLARALVSLSRLTGEMFHVKHMQDCLRAFEGLMHASASASPNLWLAQSHAEQPTDIVVVGSDAAADRLRHIAVAKATAFNCVVIPCENTGGLDKGHPAFGKTQVDNMPAAYICRDFSCLPPITAPDELAAALK